MNQGGNGNPRAAVNHEYEKTRVHALQATAGIVRSRNRWSSAATSTPRG